MKKSTLFFLILGTGWGAKLSYDAIQIQARLNMVQTQLSQVETRNANLNDQLVALQRQQKNHQPTNSEILVEQINKTDDTFWIKQHLDLIEFALAQHQYVKSLDLLVKLDQALEHYELSSALKQSLHQVLSKDQQKIQQFSQERQSQQQQIIHLLQQVNQQLQIATQQVPHLNAEHDQNSNFLEKWFKLEKVSNGQPQFMQRPLILKEAQLRLILAQQLFVQGQYIQYQQEMSMIHQLLNIIPEAQSKNLQQQLANIKDVALLPIPKLSTRALIEG